jgi:DNA gyrase subunit A
MLISSTGNIIRLSVDEVSLLHRSTQGVKLIDLSDGEVLVGMARVEREEDVPDDETESSESPQDVD